MKKKIIIAIVIICIVSICLIVISTMPNKNYVYIKDKKFFLQGKEFYPITINYIVSLQAGGDVFWPCSYVGYNKDFKFTYTQKDSCIQQLRYDMELIKDMGFNTVRMVGIGEPKMNDKKNGILSINAQYGNERNIQIELNSDKNYLQFLYSLKELFQIANESGLKVIFLTHMYPDYKTSSDFLVKLTSFFKNDTSILAYDLFNEPLYFDSVVDRKKEDVYRIVKGWHKIIKKNAPYHLSTIGLEGIREVFRWDPNILDVDFLSIHPYEYEPEQVRNEMYWYGKYIKKPWMIGETAIPADGDSISYNAQREYALNAFEQTNNCGGIGFSWWQYKDVDWHKFHANFMGVINRKGETTTSKGNKVFGTVKPVVDVFKNKNNLKNGNCKCLDNYYNYSQKKDFRLIGFIKDDYNNPIEGGVILAWNQWWTHSYHTVSKADGSFELLGNYPFYHWIASATLYTTVDNAIVPNTAKPGKNGIPTIDLGTIKIEELPF